jgi:DNA-binding response OmpR family regulator
MDKKSILLIEDDLSLQEEIKEYLSIFFDTVICCADGQEGYELYLTCKPDAVFTDINLPRLNGLDLVYKIRKINNKIPILILSAYTNSEYLLKAIELNLVTYLIKPIATHKLHEAIEKVLSQIKNTNLVPLSNGYIWDTKKEKLYYEIEEIVLSSYEQIFIKSLYQNANRSVSHIELHYAINPLSDFSKDSLTSLVKRLRKKTSKDFIESCFMEGYKLHIS